MPICLGRGFTRHVKCKPKNRVYREKIRRAVFRMVFFVSHFFLFEMAKELSDKDSLMMLGDGKSGKEPLVMNDGGKPYRAFLEGRMI